MGHKIITEKDFWQCTGGAIPTQFQSGQKIAKKKTEEKYITVLDKATVGWLDFGCTKLMLLYAVMAAIMAVIAALVIGTGGAALIAVGAVAGAAGAAYGAVVGGLTCGQMVAPIRRWLPKTKSNFKILGQDTITGANQMQCDAFTFLGMAPQLINFNPDIKNWSQAIAKAGATYIGKILEGMLAGACVGSVFAAGQALIAAGSWSGAGNVAIQFAKQAPMNFIKNIGASWGYAGGFSKSAVAFMGGLRSLMGLQGGLDQYGDTGELSSDTALAAGRGFIGMEIGLIESPYKIATGTATWHDYAGILLSFTPVHSNFDEGKPKSNVDGDGVKDADGIKNGDSDGIKDGDAGTGKPKSDGLDGSNSRKGKDGEAYENGNNPDLESVVEAEAKRLIETQSGSKNGPCLAGVFDPVTGKIFFGQNFKMNRKHGRDAYADFVNNAHEIIKNKIEQRKLDIKNEDIKPGPKDGTPGAHAEIVALDKAIKARELATGEKVTEADLGTFDLHNRTLNKSSEPRPMVRCSNCNFITDGVNTCGHQ